MSFYFWLWLALTVPVAAIITQSKPFREDPDRVTAYSMVFTFAVTWPLMCVVLAVLMLTWLVIYLVAGINLFADKKQKEKKE